MGSSESKVDFMDTPLTPQTKFVGTMSQRYVRNRQVTLELEDLFWSKTREREIEIKDLTIDPSENQVVFRVPATKEGDVPTKQVLQDAYRVQIARSESRQIGPRGAGYSVYPGGAGTPRFVDFKTEMTPFEKPLRMDFVDRTTGVQVKIGVRGKFLHRSAVIWIESGQWQASYAIARVYRKADTPPGKYLVDIAPGVDLQLIVIICGALDEQTKKHEIGAEGKAKKAAKEAAKAAKAAEKAAKKDKTAASA